MQPADSAEPRVGDLRPAPPVAWADPARRAAFEAWFAPLADAHRIDPATLRAASSDASFRRYLRADVEGGGSLIVMDAPPPQEDVRPFIHVAGLIEQAGLNAPRILASDVAHGFLLLPDMGSHLYLHALQEAERDGDPATADRLMRSAIGALVQWQRGVATTGLPDYDDAMLRRELGLFPEWCVARHCGVTWNADEQRDWDAACDLLVRNALGQPRVAVHRDYMPRNLMVTEPAPGILDFQDAAVGAISYDVASLLRDAFLSWDEERELDWGIRYWEAARKAGLPVDADFGEFWRQLEWMGLQRHLKVLGIFSRLKYRDAKPHYSEDLPRFFAYAHKVSARYNALRPLSRLLEPLMGAARLDVFY
ncbi:phosphotransferase [Schlegelella sp. ID0723]|uniref:Phosphotransferase n=1 Tax=Piscinibacter koreensis TaxID=2742824 RepID=A0A7Y6NJZ9_9BURK|nr:phosphotransferase [Schlegelella koreensis]